MAGYVEAATWADLIQSDDPDAEWGSEAGEYGVDSLDAVSLESVRSACATFVRENRADLEKYAETFSWDYAGHDFWLTRRGHGCGFWDRRLGDLGERLSEAAKAWGDPGMVWLQSDDTVRFE